ncbi:MAG: site-specific DNA-methyltransferase, partial [Candidatus Diapherotrites archaeon]
MNKIGKFAVNKIHKGDSLKLLKELPSNSADLILTDPPFAIEFKAKRANYNRTAGNVIEGYNDISQEKYAEFSLDWISESFRILKETGSMYVFSGWTNLKDILNAVDEAGFKTLNHLIWKYQFGVFTKKKFVTSHYHVLLLVKNLKKYQFTKMDHYPEDVLVVNREYWKGEKKTPTKLPLALVKKLIQYSSKEGDLVLDPFMGSGTTA